MPARYFSPISIDEPTIELSGDQAHHLLNVMRAKPGEVITLFDGSGREATSSIESTTRRSVTLKVNQPVAVSRESSRPVTIAAALPKGDRQRFLVEKLTELGVAQLQPLLTSRSAQRKTDGKTAERLARYVIEASKQCGRNILMKINAPIEFAELVSAPPKANQLLIALPDSYNDSDWTDVAGGSALVAIGPEGGFTTEEVQLAIAHGFESIGLGPRVLRIETAAITAAVLTLGPHTWN